MSTYPNTNLLPQTINGDLFSPLSSGFQGLFSPLIPYSQPVKELVQPGKTLIQSSFAPHIDERTKPSYSTDSYGRYLFINCDAGCCYIDSLGDEHYIYALYQNQPYFPFDAYKPSCCVSKAH